MIRFLLFIVGLVLFVSRRTLKVPVPKNRWRRFSSRRARKLGERELAGLEGIYTVRRGRRMFGDRAVIKWSYTISGNEKIYHLTIFCERDATYFICEGRRIGRRILLAGYWRNMTSFETGEARFVIPALRGGEAILSGEVPDSIILRGRFAAKEDTYPIQRVVLRFQRPIEPLKPFQVIAHRGGGRNSDFLPVSENSLEMIRMSAQLGATGLELDVRLSREDIPVLFHDVVLSPRSIKDHIGFEQVSGFWLEDLKKFELKQGGFIPTLEEALQTVLYETPLTMVWLDIKYVGDQEPVRRLQERFMKQAATMGRELTIYIGLPDKETLGYFTRLENYKAVPSLVELQPSDVRDVNADVWAPRWVEGLMVDEVHAMRQEGRKSFVWTMNDRNYIREYISDGSFDGIVSDFPTVVAFAYYTA